MPTASPTPSRPERTYEIHEVAQLTGLAAARLRAWERRYEVVRPRRQPNGYRAYTADQVALLRAFARLIGAGERIGDLAARPREEVLAQADAHVAEIGGRGAEAYAHVLRGHGFRIGMEAFVRRPPSSTASPR